MWKKQLFFSVFLAGHFSTSVIAGTAIAVGDHSRTEGIYPLLASSQDDGATWAYKINRSKPNLPANFSSGGFLASSCSNSNCVVAGQYTTKNFKNFPLFAFTKDKGLNWKYVLNNKNSMFPPKAQGAYNTLSCSGANCVAAGAYTIQSRTQAILIHSKDGGETWSPCSVLSDSVYNAYAASSCSGLNCVVVGEKLGMPLLVFTQNGGLSWDYGTKLNQPTDIKGGSLSAVSCSELNCVAVGSYGTDEFFYKFPLIANSTDGGKHWTYSMDNKTPELPSDFERASLSSVSCSSEYCVAVGVYTKTNHQNTPFLAYSMNGGKAWTYVLHDRIANLPANLRNGSFSGVHCSQSNCLAAGSYYDEVNSYPLLAYSKDGGASWSYSIDSTTPKLPEDFVSGALTQVNCSGSNCNATGTYYETGPYLPLLAHSEDAGVTWTYAITGSTPALPEGSIGARIITVDAMKTFKSRN